MSKIKVDIVRRIDRWFVVTDGQRYGFAWSLVNNEVSAETDLDGSSGVQWFETRYEAETALLDSLEELYENEERALPEPVINTSTFAELLGVSRQFVNSSAQRAEKAKKENRRYRGKIPAPDLYISGAPYWFQSTVDGVLRKEGKL